MRGIKESVNSNVDSMPNRTFDLEIGDVVVIERRAVPIQCYSLASSTDASNSNKPSQTACTAAVPSGNDN
jgi:hypothetical protein